jgi:hypothetical protein
MARILFLLALGVGIYLFIRHYSRKPQNTDQARPATPSRDTVQCAQCKTYVPRDEAVAMHNQFFCCKQHARDWNPPKQ